MAAAGYGMGAVVTTFPIPHSIVADGHQETLLHFGLLIGTVALLAGQGMQATTNYGFLYMAQGIGSTLDGPMAAWMHESSGSWTTVFIAVITLDFIAAYLAIAVLKPMRERLPISTGV